LRRRCVPHPRRKKRKGGREKKRKERIGRCRAAFLEEDYFQARGVGRIGKGKGEGKRRANRIKKLDLHAIRNSLPNRVLARPVRGEKEKRGKKGGKLVEIFKRAKVAGLCPGRRRL